MCCESSAARRDWEKYFGRDVIAESIIEKCFGIQLTNRSELKGRKNCTYAEYNFAPDKVVNS